MNSVTLPPTLPGLDSSWALRMKATSMEEPTRLIQLLTGSILGSGGWVLSRGANDSGTINMLFEFERMQCLEIYTVLVATGLELSQLAHMRFTELCQCTRAHPEECGGEIVSVDLEIHSFSAQATAGSRSASSTKA